MTMDVSKICLHCMSEKPSRQAVCASCQTDDRTWPESVYALAPGTTLNGKYLMGRLLGSGGFGNTYLALDTSLGIRVAIKEYLPRELAGRERNQSAVYVFSRDDQAQFQHGLEKFLEEAKALARFQDHPGIVAVRDFFHANGTAYIAMEYVDGLTLKDYVKQKGGRLPVAQVLQIMTPLMDALREVHRAGMLHRDISPDNIYITRKGQVKLLDFGAARHAMGDVSKSLSIILKPGYAPAEQYTSRGRQGPWTDV